MNEENLPIEIDTSVEEKDFPISPKSEDIKIDEINTPSITDEMGNVVIGDQSFNKIEIPQEPVPPKQIEQPIEEKVKVKGLETNLPEVVDELGNVVIGKLDPVKTVEDLLADEEETARSREQLNKSQKEIMLVRSDGSTMTMYDFLQGKGAENMNTLQSVIAGRVSGILQVGRHGVNFASKLIDYFGAPPPGKEKEMNNLINWFDKTWLGEITSVSKNVAQQTALARITEAISEIYTAGKIGTSVISGSTKVAALVEELYGAIKGGRFVNTTEVAAKAAEKVNMLNNLQGWKKWTAIGVGGGAGMYFLVPAEDLGTLGDWLGGPTKLDTEKKPLGKDDAARFFNNQLKFAGENSLFTIGIAGVVGVGKKFLSSQGKELAFSNSLVDRWIDKFASYLRPGGKKSIPLLTETEAAEGRIAAAQTTTKELIDAIDTNIVKIRKGTESLANSTKLEEFLIKTNQMLHSGDNTVQKGKIIFKGYNNKELKTYENFLKDLGVKEEQITELKGNFFKIRDSYNNFMNETLQGKNLNVGPKEFSKLMMDRVRNVLATEYRMFTEKFLIPYFSYKPAASSIEEVKQIIERNALKKGMKTFSGDSDVLVNGIISDARINSETKAPFFTFAQTDPLGTKRQITVDLSKNFVNGKFVPTELIKTKKEFDSFQKLFGARQDPRTSIINVMGDLSEFASKDKFANNIKNISENLIKNKQRSIVYDTELEAARAFNPEGTPTEWYKKIVPLDIESRIGNLYINPLNNKFTTKEWADAIKFQEKLPFEWLNDSLFWRWTVVGPKAVVSTLKTVLSPIAQIKNPLQNVAYALGTGNLFKNPLFTMRSLKQAFNSAQPQMFYKNLPKDQAMYKFLQEESIVGQSTEFNEYKKLWKSTELGGQYILNKLFGDLPYLGAINRFITKRYNNFQAMYLASDDGFKIFNFAAEHDNLRIAYSDAVKAGKLAKMPDDLTILKEAASIVRNSTPNYGRVGEGIQALRYTPIGNFPSWTAELFRNSLYIVQQGINEIKDPIKYSIGARRLLGFAAASGYLVPRYVDWARGAYGFTRDQVSSMREFLYDYEKDASIAPYRNIEGGLQYQNLSSYPFTTLSDVIQPVAVGVDNVKYNNLEDPMIKTMMIGLGKGYIKTIKPFVEESIWVQLYDTLMKNDGVTPQGQKIWNREDDLVEKWDKGIEYANKTAGLGSVQQIERILKAVANKPGEKGEKYNVSDELLGVIGYRIQDLDVPERLENKLHDYSDKLNLDLKTFTGSKILKGGLPDNNEIKKQFILANAKKYNTDSEMQRKINAAKNLEVEDSEIYKKFVDTGLRKNYSPLVNDSFQPFDITPKVRGKFGQIFQKLQDKDFNIEYNEPLDSDTREQINDIKQLIRGIPLNKNFYEYIKIKDWVSEAPGTENKVATAPLSPQPSPNAQVVQPSPQVNQGVLPNGLTRSETALLRPEEQLIKLNQRQTGLPTGQV
jgi:hypothetical protein